MTSAGPITSTTTRGVGPSPATRRSGAGSARPTAAGCPTRSSCTGRRESRPRGDPAINTRTRSTWCQLCWSRWASRHPPRLRGVAQSPIEGVSFAHSFNDAEAPTKHHTQYFEMFAHRSIYHDGWRAVCPFPGTSFAEAGVSFGMLELTEDKLRELDATRLGALPRRRRPGRDHRTWPSRSGRS